ncbi:MAG: aspartyl/glutamyl-tRNA amidotransferase subunit B [Elusimicrobia bacterium CG1_02_63_36]|nr:MAG: aspartyl/glutamyl-tRNA amidotransferase subunit B [Elusimicrobia bacterium CG1_02_63_36]
MSGEWELVVGLETHVQLATRTKLFCACPAAFGGGPNESLCPVCTGQPGALPVLNRRAVELALAAGLALECRIRERSVFARKNYFYPDLPKGYQISQYDRPFAEDGRLLAADAIVEIERIHLEEDAGKLVHEPASTGVDLNRAGTPLIEIVTRPVIASAECAHAYLGALKSVLRYCGVSNCDMEKGELRCDANISVRRPGGALGTKVELKNLNSFKAVKDAIGYEFERQAAALEAGERIVQETRLWDAAAGRSRTMRVKEEAHDYRYFPDPDLPPLEANEDRLYSIRAALPELPAAKRQRFIKEFDLSVYDAEVLSSDRPLADYFEAVLAAAGEENAKAASNWIQSELLAKLNGAGLPVSDSPVGPESIGELLGLMREGRISGKIAKEVFSKAWETGKSPAAIVEELGLVQVSDAGAIEAWVLEALSENPKAVEDLRAGKKRAAGAIVGAVMKKSNGKANPALVNKIIEEKTA